MYLVVDDEAPVPGVEDLKVGVDALPFRRHHLIRRDGDRTDLLLGARVLPDLVGGQGGAAEELVAPLTGSDGVRDEDEGCCLREGHGEGAHDGLAGAAREHDDPRAAVPKALCSLGLVGPGLPGVGIEADRMPLAIDVASDVLGGPTELDERLLEVPALARVHDDRRGVNPGPEQGGHLLAAQHFLEDGLVEGLENETVDGMVVHLQAAVARHRLGDIDEQRMGYGIP